MQLAIGLLILIGCMIAIGTIIEQEQSLNFYKENQIEHRPSSTASRRHPGTENAKLEENRRKTKIEHRRCSPRADGTRPPIVPNHGRTEGKAR